jgi:RepB DNA-primase from phage plasmid
MLTAFASVGACMFDLSLTDLSGAPVKGRQRPGKSLEQMCHSIPRVLREAECNQHNVIIRPRSATALLIQLDDFTAEQAAQVEPNAFMTIYTSPSNYQVWLAVCDGPQENDKEAAKLFRTRVRRSTGADHSATGAVRIAGSTNFKQKYAPAFPMIEVVRVAAGRTVTAAVLEKAGLLAPREAVVIPPRPVFPFQYPGRKRRCQGCGTGRTISEVCAAHR